MLNPLSFDNLIKEVNEENLKYIVKALSVPRHGWYNYNELCRIANFIEEIFNEYGYIIEIDEFSYHKRTYRNIIATKKGIESSKNWLLIGAHYDSAIDSPGADDNASAVSVMLEVARILKDSSISDQIKFVAFTLEEPQPFSINFLIGSENFVKKMKRLGYKYEAIVLESVGYYSDKPGSQHLPAFVKGPDTGNFIGVVGNKKSKSLVEVFDKAKYYIPSINVITYIAPLNGWLAIETRFSDHASFWNGGFKAVMVTDTAMFRNPYYHTKEDTPDKLNYRFMKEVTQLLIATIFVKQNLQLNGQE
ncbi:M28 family peptidase [Thermodesulfovibrio sp. 1176]|uniref:M28 family peptidase n=1 Tax=Thermodesulfovibrio sp. 1176 TaxID=3043424 RepID=UPI0024828752|nr:M28 family peptidase [Thermodesulfovibrio sp. 1176]MDI1472466.1 M28 family peptidase [Thermodesulfovibrio sp. 1176]